MRRHPLPRIRRPSPAMVLAIVAVILAAAGFAAAAIPGPGGTIHACYAKTGGNLRVVNGTKCGKAEKPLSWNQGLERVRKAVVTIHYTCSMIFTGVYSCSGTGTKTAHCNTGERATGGGYAVQSSDPAESFIIRQTKPFPTTGKPTGWTVLVYSSLASTSPTRPDAHVPIYAMCAA